MLVKSVFLFVLLGIAVAQTKVQQIDVNSEASVSSYENEQETHSPNMPLKREKRTLFLKKAALLKLGKAKLIGLKAKPYLSFGGYHGGHHGGYNGGYHGGYHSSPTYYSGHGYHSGPSYYSDGYDSYGYNGGYHGGYSGPSYSHGYSGGIGLSVGYHGDHGSYDGWNSW